MGFFDERDLECERGVPLLMRAFEREALSVAFGWTGLVEDEVKGVEGVWLSLRLRLELAEEEDDWEMLTSLSLSLDEYSEDEGTESWSFEIVELLLFTLWITVWLQGEDIGGGDLIVLIVWTIMSLTLEALGELKMRDGIGWVEGIIGGAGAGAGVVG